ncbi:hypothetical protein RMCBS344292_15628 [Rhizopus microsporus]|nr:hypothetical protein RMCBS344292_15628 [Rhizopus microsporus]
MDKRQAELHRLYKEHEYMIDNVRRTLKKEIATLVEEYDLTSEEANHLNEFIQDKATLFRYLRKNNFSVPTTLSLLLDTIKWRMHQEVDYSMLEHEFFTRPLVYFHKFDKYHRPILIIHLSQLPTLPSSSTDLVEYLSPLIIFVLETARKLVWDLCKQRIEVNDVSILETVVLIDFKNASSLPMDITLFKPLISLLRRYPGIIGTVYLLNFSWVYQGLWQMCKLVLSEEAKLKVNFPKLHELQELIEPKDILKVFGGQDPFEWSIEHDNYYQRFNLLSRCNSATSVYYDAPNGLLSRPSSAFSHYETPLGPLTPITSHSNLLFLSMQSANTNKTVNKLQDLFTTVPASSTASSPLSSSGGDHQLEISPLVSKEKLTVVDNSSFIKKRKRWFTDTRLFIQYFGVKMIKKIIQYKSTFFYWILACILLRNGIQELLLLAISSNKKKLIK